MNDFIHAKLKEITEFLDIIEKDDLTYKSKRVKTYNFRDYSLHIVFANELKFFHKGTKIIAKKVFFKGFRIIIWCKRQSS